MALGEVKKRAEDRMIKSIESLRANLAKTRAGRAHPGVLDSVMVDYQGSPIALSKVASVAVLDARSISVRPFEKKMIGAIEKAIRDADLGLNPSSQGDIIRAPIPALTEERRKEMVKRTRSEGEEAKVALRNIRREANEELRAMVKSKIASEDEERRGSGEIQKLTDKAVADIEKLLAEKEKEILTV